MLCTGVLSQGLFRQTVGFPVVQLYSLWYICLYQNILLNKFHFSSSCLIYKKKYRYACCHRLCFHVRCGDCTSRHGNCHQKQTNKKTCCYWERLFCDTDAFPAYTLSVMWQQDGGRFSGCRFVLLHLLLWSTVILLGMVNVTVGKKRISKVLHSAFQIIWAILFLTVSPLPLPCPSF